MCFSTLGFQPIKTYDRKHTEHVSDEWTSVIWRPVTLLEPKKESEMQEDTGEKVKEFRIQKTSDGVEES